MPLTLADVRGVSFSKPPVGEPGYHAGEVDELLDRVHAELARLIADNNELRSQVEQLDQQLRAMPVDPPREPGPQQSPGPVMPPLRPPVSEGISPDADHDQAAKVLILAQKMADQLREQTHAKADRMLTQARNHCAQLLSEARVTAQDMVNQARTRVETMVSDARTTAETLQRQSEDKAASLEQEAARQHAEILDALRQDKRLLENTIDDLRGFEQKYRSQLVTYLQSLLHELGGPKFAAPADPVPAPQDLVGSGRGTGGKTGQSPSCQDGEHGRKRLQK
ncbi:MAG: DivIVA domain-containing protein [Pseudonocardiales bacterium]|nr:DivIVA domain-containing protein [Pseudonocardiales bacterium]